MEVQMTFLEWLKAMSTYHLEVGKDHAMREFVVGMHKRGKAYHWDDCAVDIIGPPIGEPIFTEEEALLCNEIVAELHCEDMFTLSNQLLNEEVVIVGYDLKAQLMEENIAYHGIDFSDISELDLAILQDHIDGKHHNGRKWTVAEIVAAYYDTNVDVWETFFK